MPKVLVLNYYRIRPDECFIIDDDSKIIKIIRERLQEIVLDKFRLTSTYSSISRFISQSENIEDFDLINSSFISPYINFKWQILDLTV